MKLNKKEIENVSALAGAKRYDYFIKRVSDTEELWGLYNNGWALVSDRFKKYIPLWSHSDFAKINQIGDWSGYSPKVIELASFFDEFLMEIQRDNISVCVFLTPADYGVCPSNAQLKQDLLNEIKLYE
ncbi:MAG: DUF2750 domain-containing protein [Rickettsiaceae bacterium]